MGWWNWELTCRSLEACRGFGQGLLKPHLCSKSHEGRQTPSQGSEGGAHAGQGGVRTWTPVAATGDSQSSSKLPGGIYAIPPVSALALAIVDLGLGLQARTGVP